MDVAAVDIAAPVLSCEARPPKRHFAEMDDEGGEEPDSDELYNWMEDDEVAAEGLLIDEAPTPAEEDLAVSGATALAASARDIESTTVKP